MTELATELRMGAMTLYQHFASKDDLVDAMVDAWALELAAVHLRPFLRDDVHPGTVLQMLDLLGTHAASPRFIDALGISRRGAVRTAIDLWGGGALRQRTTLRAIG